MKKKVLAVVMCLIMSISFSTVALAKDTSCYIDIVNGKDDVHYEENYDVDFFKEADCYEDESGNLVFCSNDESEELQSGYMRTQTMGNKDVSHYISKCVVLAGLSDLEKEEVKSEVEDLRTNVARSGGGNHYEYEWDSSGVCKAYVTVYYETYTKNGNTYVRLTKVNGGFSGGGTGGASLGNGVSVTKQSLKIGQNGKTESETNYTQNQTYTKDKGTRSWSQTVPSTWKAINADVVTGLVGADLTITLKRGSTWTVYVNNNIVDNVL